MFEINTRGHSANLRTRTATPKRLDEPAKIKEQRKSKTADRADMLMLPKGPSLAWAKPALIRAACRHSDLRGESLFFLSYGLA